METIKDKDGFEYGLDDITELCNNGRNDMAVSIAEKNGYIVCPHCNGLGECEEEIECYDDENDEGDPEIMVELVECGMCEGQGYCL